MGVLVHLAMVPMVSRIGCRVSSETKCNLMRKRIAAGIAFPTIYMLQTNKSITWKVMGKRSFTSDIAKKVSDFLMPTLLYVLASW